MMLRNTAREIAVHLAYELSFTALPVEELLETHLNAERFAELAGEHPPGGQRHHAGGHV